jgi:DTW domain-containing protein YfiP
MNNEEKIRCYLDSFRSLESWNSRKQWLRKVCCGTSRSLYCPECYELLIPAEDWPKQIEALPFHLDIVVHDRRNVATGLHAKILNDLRLNAHESFHDSDRGSTVRIFDLERLDSLPSSFPDDTYLLFPSEDSVPLTSPRRPVNTLVVLDCKWTKSSSRHHPVLLNLPRVHLSDSIGPSFYWRWHAAGPSCLSTIEAIYEAARELEPQKDWLPWLWLFALQRAATGGGPQQVVSQNDKLRQMELRKTKGTPKHQQDKEKGKITKSLKIRDNKNQLQLMDSLESTTRASQARKPQWQICLEFTEAEKGISKLAL